MKEKLKQKKYNTHLLPKPKIVILVLFTTLLTIFFTAPVFSINTSACYRVEVFFFKVGESCISFQEQDNLVSVKSFMRTVNIGSLARRVEDKGEAVIEKKSLKPLFFKFYQEEGRFKRYQEYKYRDNQIYVRETKYVGLSNEIEKDEKKVYPHNNYGDPYATALYLFENIDKVKDGILRLFYDDKFYNVPYNTLREEKISVNAVKYDTYKVLVKPKIQGKGLLKPKGDWILWIDKKSKMPVKMSVGFLIGSVDVLIESLK